MFTYAYHYSIVLYYLITSQYYFVITFILTLHYQDQRQWVLVAALATAKIELQKIS